MSAWRTFRRLPPLEQRLCLQAMMILICTIVGLKLAGLRRCQSALARVMRAAGHAGEMEPEAAARRARMIARAVRRVGHHGPCRSTCLAEALVVWSLLRRNGIASDLQIGVRKSGMSLEAHAWIVRNGRPVTENDAASARSFVGLRRHASAATAIQ